MNLNFYLCRDIVGIIRKYENCWKSNFTAVFEELRTHDRYSYDTWHDENMLGKLEKYSGFQIKSLYWMLTNQSKKYHPEYPIPLIDTSKTKDGTLDPEEILKWAKYMWTKGLYYEISRFNYHLREDWYYYIQRSNVEFQAFKVDFDCIYSFPFLKMEKRKKTTWWSVFKLFIRIIS